ncbi:MAG: manganese catalase family protein [Clostridia bacterium]|nr:manganese catalase family protein [Clostridia bacterium]
MENLVKKEYPKVRDYCKNSYYSGILQNLYSGSEGETAVFLQFRYHSYILDRFNEDLSQLLRAISFDDLKHQELLANAIQMTSSDPKYCNSEGKWLGGRQIDYIKETRQVLALNLELKEKTVIDYKIAISKIDNQQIKELLSAILADEEKHRLLLKQLIEKLT